MGVTFYLWELPANQGHPDQAGAAPAKLEDIALEAGNAGDSGVEIYNAKKLRR